MAEYLTITQAAKLKGCTRVTIYKWLEQGKLTSMEVAGKKFVVKDGKFAEAKSEMEGQMRQVERLEERLVRVEEGNEELRKMAEETLAKLAALEKAGVKVNTKGSVKMKNR